MMKVCTFERGSEGWKSWGLHDEGMGVSVPKEEGGRGIEWETSRENGARHKLAKG